MEGKNRTSGLLLAGIALAAAVASAMPTRRQLAAAQERVGELVAADVADMNAKRKTPAEVAAAHLDLADKAESEAGKFLLLQGAFRIYARSGDYGAAAAALKRMRGEIAGLPPEVVVEIVGGEMRRVPASRAPEVHAIFRDAQRKVRCRRLLAAAEAESKAKPYDSAPRRRIAECHAGLGDWPKALAAFARLGVKAAKWEIDPSSAKDCDAVAAADFWWKYDAQDAEPYRVHAAALYRRAIDDGTASGLVREMAQKRVAEMEGACAAAASPAAEGAEPADAEPASPWAVPANRGGPVERTLELADGVEMAFCACPAGSFKMSSAKGNMAERGKNTHKATITRPFWFSKTLVTTKQYRVLKPNRDRDAQCAEVEALFPDSDIVHPFHSPNADGFIAGLNARFGDQLPEGYVFRLPTEAEWEYAICDAGRQPVAGMKQFWNSDKNARAQLERVKYDKSKKEGLACIVLPRTPANRLGIIGAGTELLQPVLDAIDAQNDDTAGECLAYAREETDPLRTGSSRLFRHGITGRRNRKQSGCIFRVVIGPDLAASRKP